MEHRALDSGPGGACFHVDELTFSATASAQLTPPPKDASVPQDANAEDDAESSSSSSTSGGGDTSSGGCLFHGLIGCGKDF